MSRHVLGMAVVALVLACGSSLLLAKDAATQPAFSEVARHPDRHVGPLTVTGVVAVVSPGKGFLLIDPEEYRKCGLECVSESSTARLPVEWSGAPPLIGKTLRVSGRLERDHSGFHYAATGVEIR